VPSVTTLRSASVGATSLGTANLGLTESSLIDPLTVSCGATPGQHLTDALGALSFVDDGAAHRVRRGTG